jgi:Domain of unknown function (DUF5134)
MTPAWILDILAALMLAVAAVSAARALAARPWRRESVLIDTDVAHLLMAIAMAGMLASSIATLPDTAWEVIFGLLTAWFAYRVARDARASGIRALAGGHCAPHLVHSAAMLYMFLALVAGTGISGMGGMSGPGGSAHGLRYPTLVFAFALILVGYSIWDLDQLSGRRYALSGARVSLAAAASVPVPAMSPAGPLMAAISDPRAARLPAPAGPAVQRNEGQTGGTAAARLLLSPAATIGCRIAMGVTMALMLLIAH